MKPSATHEQSDAEPQPKYVHGKARKTRGAMVPRSAASAAHPSAVVAKISPNRFGREKA